MNNLSRDLYDDEAIKVSRQNCSICKKTTTCKAQCAHNVCMKCYAKYVHDNNGFVLATNVNSKLAQTLNRLQGSKYAPDGVEIFNAKSGGYRDVDIDFPRFINSGSTSANDLDNSSVFTLIHRKDAQEMGLIQGDQGVEYTPKYLRPNTGVV